MLLLIGAFFTLTAMLVIAKVRLPASQTAPNLGWMSQQWLAEYRASHP
jgi:hypothetical protein